VLSDCRFLGATEKAWDLCLAFAGYQIKKYMNTKSNILFMISLI
jgi:hypothetical protein